MALSYSAVTVTITAGTLAAASARESASITTDTTKDVEDYRVQVDATANAGSPTGSKGVFVWVKTSQDGGTTWDGNATGADTAIALDSPHQFNLGVAIPFPSSGLTRAGTFSLRSACGGSLPKTWGIIVENQVGFALTGVSVVCHKVYTP
jgi:hypothetical protein